MLSIDRLKRLCSLAKREALKSVSTYKVGAIIFDGSKIFSKGNNHVKSSPLGRQFFKDGSHHAEIMAVTGMIHKPYLMEGLDIFVCRLMANGSFGMAKPCPMCTCVLYKMGIKRAYWTSNEFPFYDFAKVKDLYNDIDFETLYNHNCDPLKYNPPCRIDKRFHKST